jgi:hypothetical protein
MDMSSLGRWLVVFGVLLVVFGIVLMFSDRIPWLGRLPGDIVVQRDGVTVFIPIATMIVVSVVLTAVLNLAARLFR